jgi:Terminase large subunit, T4likevirus-type, N-terminal
MSFTELSSPLGLALALGFQPEPLQARILSGIASNLIFVAPRQYGKTTLAVLHMLWLALIRPGALILIAAPSARQSAEVLESMQPYVALCGFPWRGDGVHPNSLRLPNGSRIIALPSAPHRIRGFAKVAMVTIDEAAYVDDKLYEALLPMLSVSNGEVWLVSTPHRKLGFFHDIFHNGGSQWRKLRATLQDSSHHNMDQVTLQRLERGEDWFRQEYMAEFTSLGQGLFTLEMIEACFSDEVEEIRLCS